MYYFLLILSIFQIHVYSNQFETSLINNNDEEDLSGSSIVFDTTTENYTVPVSGKCILTCYIADVRSFKVLWQKIDRTNFVANQTNDQDQLTLIAFDGVVYSNKDHYRLESDYVGSYNLIIDRVNEDDQGEYQCQINTEPRKTKRIFLTVQVPPRIVDFRPNPPLLSIQTGTSLTLFCRAEGTPSPRIRWRIRDLDINQIDSSPPDNSNTWFIPSINNSFPRTVECIADNGVLPASNRIFTINIEFPPIITINNDLIQTKLNENITLECSVLSRPIARILWIKNGILLEQNHMIITQINQTMLTNQLNIQLKTNDDFGPYTCIAENSHGQIESTVFVLQETIRQTTISTKTINYHLKSSLLKNHSSKKMIRSTTHINLFIERDIRITSSSEHLFTLNKLRYVCILLTLLYRIKSIYR